MLASLSKIMSAGENGHIVIFKSFSDSDINCEDVYYKTFLDAGYEVTLVPTLEFEFVNLEEFFGKIQNFNEFEGIIFSSPRCVKAFELSIGKDTSLINKWRDKNNYVVGEATGKAAEKLGLIVTGHDAGNGNALAEIILKRKFEKPFLHPVGSLAQSNFKLKLLQGKIEVDEPLVYLNKPHPQLEKNISRLKVDGINFESVIFIYFSPSGVKYSFPILKSLNVDLSQIKFVAVGSVTEAEIIENGLKVAKTAVKPNPKSLLQAISSIKT